MATVYIPALLQPLTGGRASVEAEGATVRQLIENLDRAFPGIRDRLLEQDRLRPNISVAVDGEVTPLGMLEKVGPVSEVHFVAAIKGGRGPEEFFGGTFSYRVSYPEFPKGGCMQNQWIPCVVLTAMTASLGLADEWKKNFTVSGHPDLRVTTTDGSVTVRPWERNEIGARVVTNGWQIRPSEVRVTDHQAGDRVEIEVHTPKEFVGFGRHSVEVEVLVPHELSADIHSGDGHISAQDLKGEIHLSTGDGGIEANAIDGILEAKTGDGSIRVSGRWDRLDLRTDDGSVEAAARTGSKMTGAWSVHTGDGHITLRVPDNFAADLDADTGDGKVTVDFPVTVSGSIGGGKMRGKLNGGGQTLTLRTGDGAIHIERL